ncbi:hypothetical protein N7466_005761 [Penicillium verhagenii]|uniref:uncharacterized protein n=1 Tax=Penicillium verhagenii TaxID=1562060 RepID=UPI00254520B9|nr:uncharacterized protein N7466_005761 [Penicillium verhagenii]KAJ5930268.1 hypothetical protein N7466_005761 [Penicillium verhagenii]
MAGILQPKSQTTVFLDQPPSCLEFCPEIRDHFVVGTYLLSETKNESGEIQQTKTGSLQLWKLDPNTNVLSLKHRLALPYAVFDLHFHPREKNKFAIVGSTGLAALFSVSDDSTQPTINHIWSKQIHEDTSIPALFFVWAPQDWFPQPASDGFAVTFSDSQTTVFGTNENISDENEIEEWGSYQAQQMIEVWFVALAAIKQGPVNAEEHTDGVIPFMFTGNDFGSLHTRRFQNNNGGSDDDDEPLAPLLLEHDDRARHHTAGVTAILPLEVDMVDEAPILLTGSYDESLRVYHASRRGEVLAEQGLGGGVWRLQLLSSTEVPGPEDSLERQFVVLASCMHAGTRVVQITQQKQGQGPAEWDIQVLAEFTEHESMNYASDVWKGAKSEQSDTSQALSELLCVSSSFYDRRLCVWRVTV